MNLDSVRRKSCACDEGWRGDWPWLGARLELAACNTLAITESVNKRQLVLAASQKIPNKRHTHVYGHYLPADDALSAASRARAVRKQPRL